MANAAKVNAGLAMPLSIRAYPNRHALPRLRTLEETMPEQATFDRDSAGRARAQLLDELIVDTQRRVVITQRGQLLMRDGELLHDPDPEIAGVSAYLGALVRAEQRTPLELRILTGENAPHGDWVGLRELINHPDPLLAEVATTAIALTNWHSAQRHCPSCGSVLEHRQAGWVLGCSECGTLVWPRTDPAIIVLVEDAAGRVLLGSNAMWEHNRYSLLAGFVEPGESLESAVVREIAEESGVIVSQPRYLASQSWPLPQSLMLGFRALAESDALTPDGEEILDLRWFDRDSIQSADILLPRRGSLARRLLEDWFGGPIPDTHG